jgi:hypothetical protein
VAGRAAERGRSAAKARIAGAAAAEVTLKWTHHKEGIMPLISLFSNNLPDFFIIQWADLVDIAKIEADAEPRESSIESVNTQRDQLLD